jgi:hypothetical protein
MTKYKILVLGLIADAVGFASYLIPGLGELSDLIWAPLSAWFMTKLYKGKAGNVGAVVNLFEEILPGTDFIPTFTIMWFYTYIFKTQEKPKDI